MAETIFDAVGLMQDLGLISLIFPLLIIFGIVFGILEKTKIFSDRTEVNAIIGLGVGFLVAASRFGVYLAEFIPTVSILIVMTAFLVMIGLFLGLKEKDLAMLGKHKAFMIFMVLIFIIFAILIADGIVFNLRPQLVSSGNVTNVSEGVIHGYYYEKGFADMSYIIGSPKLVGAIIFLGILAIAVPLISSKKIKM